LKGLFCNDGISLFVGVEMDLQQSASSLNGRGNVLKHGSGGIVVAQSFAVDDKVFLTQELVVYKIPQYSYKYNWNN
jgi:hypothetical protein